MIKSLGDFIPVSGNTHDLQNRRTELGAWFMKTAASVNPRVSEGITSQGFYVVAADGTAFGFNNNRSVERVLGFMADGLRKFRSAPPRKVDIPVLQHAKVQPPMGSLVLRVYSRILPTPEGCNESNKNLQRDHLWILPEEASALAEGRVPDALRMRILRFTLVDAVRGEPDFWAPTEIVASSLGVAGNRLTGSFSMKNAKQTLKGTIDAELTIERGRVTGLKGYADCVATGSGTWTPGAPNGEFPLKFAIVAAPTGKDTVAPQAAMYGREYLTGR